MWVLCELVVCSGVFFQGYNFISDSCIMHLREETLISTSLFMTNATKFTFLFLNFGEEEDVLIQSIYKSRTSILTFA